MCRAAGHSKLVPRECEVQEQQRLLCYTKVLQVPAAHATSVLGISLHITSMLFPSLSASNFRLPHTEQTCFPFADSFLHPFINCQDKFHVSV